MSEHHVRILITYCLIRKFLSIFVQFGIENIMIDRYSGSYRRHALPMCPREQCHNIDSPEHTAGYLRRLFIPLSMMLHSHLSQNCSKVQAPVQRSRHSRRTTELARGKDALTKKSFIVRLYTSLIDLEQPVEMKSYRRKGVNHCHLRFSKREVSESKS